MPPEYLSHYKLAEELGRGGMATVYRALDMENKRPVALKVLHQHLSSDEIAHKRFVREAQAGMSLDHPGIVKVYEVGEAANSLFIAMELVEGKTLEEVVQEKTLSVEMAIDLGITVADALAVAHKRGIVHRDIKPRNIMMRNDGKIKVMDLGLAKLVDASSLTIKHEIVGSFFYMSPQQAMGAQIDGRSDLFSLGVVLYQVLTGARPFDGDHPRAIIHAILHSDPLRMEEVREGIPVEMEQVVFKALQKRPQDRYQSATELKTDLEKVKEILNGNPHRLIATDEVFEERARGIYSPLVGRDREMAILEGHLERMLKGEGSTVMVRGEAGIGKSRLVWELGRKAKQKKARYFVGRCLFGGESIPYQPIIEAVRSYLELKRVKTPELLSAFIQDRAHQLIGRMGVIQAFLLMESEKTPSLISKEQLWDTATELVKMIAQDRPIVLHVEDLQWADSPTMNLITYLSTNTQGERILIIGTYRPEELGGEAEEKGYPISLALERMHKKRLYKEICLERLDRRNTHKVISSVFQGHHFPEKFTSAIYEETEGNPLFVLEMLELLQEEGMIRQEKNEWNVNGDIDQVAIPRRVNDVITNRLKRLNRVERSVIDVAAVDGRWFQSDILHHCLKIPRMRVLHTLQDLENSHHLIHASEKEYHFDHAMIREVVYNSLIPELRKEYHRLIGAYLIENFKEKGEFARKIANHLFEAGEEKEALHYLIKAGEHARKFFANEEAIEYYDRGIALVDKLLVKSPTPALHCLKLSQLKVRAHVKEVIGSYEEARSDYECILKLSQKLGKREERSYGLHGIGRIFGKTGNYKKALSHFEQALAIQKKTGDKRGEASTLNDIAAVYHNQGDYEQTLAYLEQALSIARETGHKLVQKQCLNNIGLILEHRGQYELALNHYEKALQIERQIKDRRGEGSTLSNIGKVQFYRGNYQMALKFYKQALHIEKQIGDKQRYWESQQLLFRLWLDVGDKKRALESFEETKLLADVIGTRRMDVYSVIDSGMAKCLRGSLEDAVVDIKKGLELAKKMNEIYPYLKGLGALAFLEFSRNNLIKARGYLEEMLSSAVGTGIKRQIAQAHLLLARIHLSAEDFDEAQSHATRAQEIANECGMKEFLWQAHHCLGKVYLKKEQCPRAREELRRAQQVVDQILYKLGDELRRTYLAKAEIEELRLTLKAAEEVN